MKVNPINNCSQQVSAKAKIEPKIFSGELYDGSIAQIRIMHNGNKVRSMECYTFKDGKPVGGMAIGKNNGLKLKDMTKFLTNIYNKSASEFNVFRDFMDAIMR